ncbi:hypothetical protein [Nocardioides jensenii]|uniref:hypothetical protein n=1 Tax=Nocardioides jensenii TaxID=1843 RepID=UPI0008299A8D|nr:hypothetical protein [Nocardioides jensenii]
MSSLPPRGRMLATLAAAALTLSLTAAPAAARPCLDCEEPELPGPGGGSLCGIAPTSEPTITTATPRVGLTATGTRGTWAGNPTTFSYQWLVDGTAVAGGGALTSPALPASTYGKELVLRVIATRETCETKVDYSAAKVVAVGSGLVATSTPTLSGDPKVGDPVTVSTGTWSPAASSHIYQWQVDGVDVAGATSSQFTPSPAQVGKAVRVRVTAATPGHSTGSALTPARTVLPDDLAKVSAPTVTGTAVFGRTLTATPGAYDGNPAVVSVEWLRNGTPISGATALTYRVGLKDVGQVVSVRETASKPGVTDVSQVTVVGRAVAATMRWASARKLQVKGVARLSRRLRPSLTGTALRRGTSPDATRVSYQWLRGTTVIRKATSRTYVLRRADLGKRLRLRVTLARPGHRVVVLNARTTRIRR